MAVTFKKVRMNGWLLFFSIAVSLLILELGLRIVSPPNIFTPHLPLRPMAKLKLHVNLRGVAPVAHYTTNSWGLRGDKPPTAWKSYLTMVTIGGSSTQCLYLDDQKTWPFLLQENLKDHHPHVWVGNGGIDGHTTRGHLLFMEKVITRIRPDMVIFLTGINDLGLSISKERFLYGSPFDKAGLRSPPSWRDWLLVNSRIVQIIYLWKWIYLHDVTVTEQAGHENFVPKPIPREEVSLPDRLDSMLPQLDEYRQNLRALIQKGRSLKVETVFLTQPMLFDDSAYWKGIEGRFYWIPESKHILSAATYARLLDRYNQALLEVCREEGAHCFDLAHEIPHDERYFYDSSHFTELGAALVASKVSAFLLNQMGIKKS